MVALAFAGDSAVGPVLLGLVVILVAAKLGGELFARVGQPAVLGELGVGILLGNLHHLGVPGLEFLGNEKTLHVLAEIGIVLLLFEVGLESTVGQMLRVGVSALLVAVIGVVVPATLGYGAAWWFFPGESRYSHVFVGTILCATSVGITARVLQELRRTKTRESQIILGAAVIDDVLGLIVLATVSGMIVAAGEGRELGAGAVGWISGKALLFLVGSVLVGQYVSPRLFRFSLRLRSHGLLLTLTLGFCFFLAWLSWKAGLAPIVGAFTAGLVLEEVHFTELATRERKSLHELLHPLTSVLLPVFFVLMGLRVDVKPLLDVGILGFAGVLTAGAILGKLVAGLGVIGGGVDRLAVGIGMIPRGEVGLIFAGVGLTLSLAGKPVVSPAVYSAVVLMVMVTTVLTPPLLKRRMGKGPVEVGG